MNLVESIVDSEIIVAMIVSASMIYLSTKLEKAASI
jgi:hypothetical protein